MTLLEKLFKSEVSITTRLGNDIFRVLELNQVCKEQCTAILTDCILQCPSDDATCLSRCIREDAECTESKYTAFIVPSKFPSLTDLNNVWVGTSDSEVNVRSISHFEN